ncbi:chaperone Clpb, putative [Entamoeba invadens IP1]|uniref:Chaperone Clpb, putative n=1 Tax=Entamoeba invadens IP1 TaxID=370355 RepID=A0A0A1U9B2_ENTIV|nr:chaperone Clpb, putative [Entamoeba invadens IP1]ELP88533.1 chaperone Clpb, putative [Entamoeba invadens IP1]|eukprot:XP_004255304.1 chaperone Clpb, putative [Entamoeba invadens IP1]
MTQNEKTRLLKLGDELHKRVVVHDILRSRSLSFIRQITTKSFMFLGSSGIGKTEIAKTCADKLFDDYNNNVRIDTSEYMKSHGVSRLIEAPLDNVGHDKNGQLIETVIKNTYSFVLVSHDGKRRTVYVMHMVDFFTYTLVDCL